MLTRLKVKGFKNLVDVDVQFGPFTCVAGPNGAGKSNLFDAIAFLSHLADKFFVDAVRSVRGGDDPAALFSDPASGIIEFRAEMLIPEAGFDDFGQRANASATFVYYELSLALEKSVDPSVGSRIRLEREELNYIPKGEAAKYLPFVHSRRWRDSAVRASARRTTFIQTDEDQRRGKVVRLQSDRMQDHDKARRGGGGATGFPANSLPRTVLSSAQNADETRTAVLVRHEMRSWRQLQLEPSALRSIDDFESNPRMDSSGRHIPAVLNRLSRAAKSSDEVYIRLANSLVSLVEDVRSVRVDRDESRRALRFMMKDRNDLELPAGSLSDGTMRFVALSVIELDPEEGGLVCLEEPENGIHPQRVNAMLDLLYRIAVDTDLPVNIDNPLRQVIISTHSPSVVRYVDGDDVVFAVSETMKSQGARFRSVSFLGLPGSWRAKGSGRFISDGQAIAYLRGLPLNPTEEAPKNSVGARYSQQLSLPFDGGLGQE
ncbi:MAG TPA: AAA family ATPase [Rudaea sp.]|nr:AAA family ATPase [Rudaea sp.]